MMKKNRLLLNILALLLLSNTAYLRSGAQTVSGDVPPINEKLQPNERMEGEPVQFSTLKERMAHHKVPGVSIAFLKNHKILWTYSEGVTDYKTNKPIDENTVFQAASISKPVFATVLMKYRQDHGLDLDTDVNNLLKSWNVPAYEWQENNPVTLRRLLSHSAGTTVNGFAGYASDQDVPTIIEVLQGASPANSDAVIVDTEPGSIYRYSGGGTTLAQLVFQDVTNMNFPQLAKTTIFDPLGMDHSRYSQPLKGDLKQNFAVPYRSNGTAVKGGAHNYSTLAAAGLWTTPSDIMRWAGRVQLAYTGDDQSVISQKTITEMLTPQIRPVGIGFFLEGEEEITSFSHSGANEGFRANFFAHTQTGDGVAIMTNSDSGGALITEIMNRIAEIYNWSEFKPVIKTKSDLD